MKERFFRPSCINVPGTQIPLVVTLWHWKEGDGLYCHLTDGRIIRADYNLTKFLVAVKERRESAVEVSACHSCGNPCECLTRIVCKNCEEEYAK